jgi:hypothetical protein
VDACSPFIYIENLVADAAGKSDAPPQPVRKGRNELRGDAALVRLLRTAVEQTSDDDGWAHLGRVGQYISNNSSFSAINYGYKKLSDLIRASELFEVRGGKNDNGIYVRDPRV